MDTFNPSASNGQNNTEVPVSSAQPMSPLELNDIRLDIHHTILTPDYLKQAAKKG